MEAINYTPGGQNMILTEDAQIVQGVSGNACYLPAGTGKIPIAGDRNELSLSLWRQWDGVVEQDNVRGVFSFKNIQVFFDNISDFLTVVVNGFKVITDIKDDQKRAHWCFTFVKNDRFTVYKNAKEIYSLAAGDKPVDMADGFIIGGGRTHATFDEVRVYKTVLKQGEINGLFHLVSKGTQVKQVEKLVQGVTPKYLGVVETVPTTRTAVITKGPRLGAQDANGGDWVLMGKTSGGWKCGVCYRWTGSMWINLEPEYNYIEQYQAALYHICEIPELMKNTGHFGALFAKVLVAQKALIDKLVAQEAFINKLAANQAFLRQLIVQQLKIDSDPNSNTDFEAWFDKTNGLKIKNKGQEIFRVDTTGNVFAKNAFLQKGIFDGEILTDTLVLSKATPKSDGYVFQKGSTAIDIKNKCGNSIFRCGGKYKNEEVEMIIPNTEYKILYKYYYQAGFYKQYWIYVFVDKHSVQLKTKNNSYLFIEHTVSANQDGPDVGDMVNETDIGWFDKFGITNVRVDDTLLIIPLSDSKTMKIHNLPTVLPSEKDTVWVDANRFIRLS